MLNPINELRVGKFDTRNIYEKIKRYTKSNVKRKGIAVFACDARTLYLFSKKSKYIYQPYKEADIILPDGRPVYWLSILRSTERFEHITGPEFMASILDDQDLRGKKHMFYGGQVETIQLLQKKCEVNDINAIYFESPPMLNIDSLEVEKVQNLIEKYNPDFFWCGLGAPKQEYLINNLQSNNVVMAGVGLGFDYYVGKVRRAPRFFTLIGLEWVFRYSQQPLRVARFVKPLFFMLRLLFFECFKGRRLGRR